MATEREKRIKQEFRKKAQRNPEKYYPVEKLKEYGFKRFRCSVCGNYFWSVREREVCGDPNCTGKYEFIEKSVVKELDFIEVWKKFSFFFKKLGYTPINRYPVVARWREDIFFVEASIDDFIPHVLEGVAKPPANPLVVPQFCLRFNDVENVGVTGRHYTGFVMIGQHAFEKPENYKPEEYLEHIILWLTKCLGIPIEEIQFHEDAWAGSNKMGPSLEYFSLGLELGNQVYMQYDISSDVIRELPLKVLDMGTGQERYAWYSSSSLTSYECVMPTAVNYLRKATGIKRSELYERFIPYSGVLNLDEVVDIDKAWKSVAEKMGVDVKELKESVYPNVALYSIAEHTRTLLIAVKDGALPSNVGGGYNLRYILRRCFRFIEKLSLSFDFLKVFEEHAGYLKKQYPELKELPDILHELIEHEWKRFRERKEKVRKVVERVKKKGIDVNLLAELYDSHGLTPEEIKELLGVSLPENFFEIVRRRHERVEKKEQVSIDVSRYPKTRKLYYEDQERFEFSAKVLGVEENAVILDRTYFYPRGGGQESDRGFIAGKEVINVVEKDGVVLHFLSSTDGIKAGDVVKCVVDKERRKVLEAHHTAVHILNYACRKVLGEHVYQAGAYKDEHKARLDITHFKPLTPEEIKEIERECNRVVAMSLPVEVEVLERADAEKRYGFRIYQGGFIPSGELRIVKIGSFDAQACCGLHVKNTGDVKGVLITSVSKLQDSVVRIEIVAGKRFEELVERFERAREMFEREAGVDVRKGVALLERIEEIKEVKKKVVPSVSAEEIGKNLYLVYDTELEKEKALKVARELSKGENVVVVYGKSGLIVVACGEESKINASSLLKEILSELRGKGGGRETIAIGKIGEACSREELKEVIASAFGRCV